MTQEDVSGIATNSTMSKSFFDTNILVYASDKSDPGKRDRARTLLGEAALVDTGVISIQVLQEFFVVATKKLGIDPLDAKGILESFENFEVVQVTQRLIRDAIDMSVLNRLSFWDALIVAAAESAACELLVTEDMSDGQVIKGVRITNPYQPA